MNIRTTRLLSHQLVNSTLKSAEEVVAYMGAMQAQNVNACKWAIGLRSKANINAINKALDEGRILRTHVMRPTWHIVSAENIRWMQELTRQNVERMFNGYVRQHGISISERLYCKAIDIIVKALEGGNSLTREELADSISKAGLPVSPHHINAYISHAEIYAIICSGRLNRHINTYMLIDERVAPQKSIPRDEALTRLAKLYFQSHSPATELDFAWWSGLSLGDVRKAIASISTEMEEIHIYNKVYYLHNSCRTRTVTRNRIHLLPPFDEYIVGYKDRSDVLDKEFSSKAFTNNGIFFPVVAVGGEVCGNWNVAAFAKTNAIDMTPFNDSVQFEAKAKEKAEAHYRRYSK